MRCRPVTAKRQGHHTDWAKPVSSRNFWQSCVVRPVFGTNACVVPQDSPENKRPGGRGGRSRRGYFFSRARFLRNVLPASAGSRMQGIASSAPEFFRFPLEVSLRNPQQRSIRLRTRPSDQRDPYRNGVYRRPAHITAYGPPPPSGGSCNQHPPLGP